MVLAHLQNDSRAERMVRQTLHEQLHLLDQAWGGVYQYSTGGDWNSPDFEKIMQMQSENLRIYSQACARSRAPRRMLPPRLSRRHRPISRRLDRPGPNLCFPLHRLG